MLQDLKFGLKMLWKEKAFSSTALLTLALCIGANTAIFTVLHAIVLAPLPYPEPERIVNLYNLYPGVGVTDRGSNGVPDYLDRRKLTEVFDSVALIGDSGYDVGMKGAPVRVDGQYVTPDFFTVLRAQPFLGRAFTADDAVLGKEKVALLSYGLWKDLYARDPNVLGRDIRLSGAPYRIIGVMPESFHAIGRRARLWVPFAFRPDQTANDSRHSNSWGMIARLKPGVTLRQAQQRIDALNRANLDLLPELKSLIISTRFYTKVAFLKDELVRDVRPILYLLQFAVGFVLLIGCVNVANLMLVRSNIRIKELAVRFSLGAGRWRLARQLLTESVMLAAAGGALGIAVGAAGVRLLAMLGASEMPRGEDLGLNLTVLGFSALIAVLTGLAFGSIPVFHLFRRDLNAVFRQTERSGTAQRQAMWTRSALVICQVSLAFVLLIGAGLLTASFARLLAVDPGFKPEQVLTARFSLPDERYKDDARASGFALALLERVRALPGVKSAGATTYLPFSGNNNASAISIVGRPLAPGENPPVPGMNYIDSGYLQAMGIPVLKGRGFNAGDGPNTQRVVLIDQFLARKYWPKGDPLGARIQRFMNDKDKPWTIVGVVGMVKTGNLAEDNPVGQVYFPISQNGVQNMHVVVKTYRPDPQIASALRRELLRADPELALFDVKTMPERLARSVADRRAAMVLCVAFGGLALMLSAIGIYGVLAYAVAQRTREFGIRVALGAGARDVLTMVAGQGARLAAAGLAAGVVAALGLTRLMTSLLFDVKPADPAVFATVTVLLAAVAMLASLIPSLRALRIRPAIALRYE